MSTLDISFPLHWKTLDDGVLFADLENLKDLWIFSRMSTICLHCLVILCTTEKKTKVERQVMGHKATVFAISSGNK